MTPNTSPKKPAWFALTENSAASAQVRKVDKKLPVATAIVALAIVAFGTFFANGSMNFDSSPTSNLAGNSMSKVTSSDVNPSDVNQGDVGQTTAVTGTPVQSTQSVKSVKVLTPQSMNGIVDPTLNGGGDGEDDDEDDGEDDDEDDDDDRD